MEEMIEEEDYKNMDNYEKYDRIIRNIKKSVRIATYGNNETKSEKDNKWENKLNNRNKGNDEGKVFKKRELIKDNNENVEKSNKNNTRGKKNPVS